MPVPVIEQVSQDLTVSPQLGMHVPYIIILVTVEAVIVVIAALIGTEFLIRPAKEPGSAVKTYSFHSVMFYQIYKIFYLANSLITLIMISKSVYKRL